MMADSEEKQKKKKSGTVFRIIVLLIMVVIVILLLLQRCEKKESDDSGVEASVKAKLGQLEGKTPEEVQAELNRVVEEGMFHIVINSDPVFANGEAEGNLEIENVPGNLYGMRVEITLDDTGELVYDSGLFDPNYHIQTDKLLTDLPAGDYPASAMFYAYDPDTLTQMGSVGCQLIIHVLYD